MIKYLSVSILFLFIVACNDEISYELVKPQPGQQKVLVEEISGVRCPNCPDGSRLLKALNEDFDSSLIVVTYHAGSFSVPYDKSKYNFKTNQSVAILDLLGPPEGYPSAAIQRIAIEGRNTYQRLPNTWASAISAALSNEPVVALKLSVDSSKAFTTLHISTLFLEEINKPVYMTAYVIENGLTDLQADSQIREEYVVDYVHNHVLREILTPVTGIRWGDDFKELESRDDELYVEFSKLEHVIDPAKTAFVVFLHTKEKVLQVQSIEN